LSSNKGRAAHNEKLKHENCQKHRRSRSEGVALNGVGVHYLSGLAGNEILQ